MCYDFNINTSRNNTFQRAIFIYNYSKKYFMDIPYCIAIEI